MEVAMWLLLTIYKVVVVEVTSFLPCVVKSAILIVGGGLVVLSLEVAWGIIMVVARLLLVVVVVEGLEPI